MKFGVVLHVTATYANWDNFSSLAREAEQLGYDSVWISDHFISPGGRSYGLEPWTVLSALASITRKIRLGTYVLSAGYYDCPYYRQGFPGRTLMTRDFEEAFNQVDVQE
jgi:alkanesulfonate monooxygenase SsuD/methylene tetrahydromethanopterin reductase-like flavin-dependent oxidoreductase (luciferase family)